MFKGLKAGDEVYYVERGKIGKIAKIAKVGRKYFTIDTTWVRNSRFSLDTGWIDSSYSNNSRCWISKEVYEASNRRDIIWRQVRDYFYNKHQTPIGISEEQLREIAKLVGLELKEEHDGAVRD